ncbi:amidohydrolase family protein [Candidatus Fermentibacteria bacterium]|nr:amidohydrolase family protein [Candidatus Fermentibacteria bacterium]
MTVEDMLVEAGTVAARGTVSSTGAEIVPCEGLWVLPGVVDPHVHLFLKAQGVATADDVASGSRSALVGGVTTVADFAEVRGSLSESLARHGETWRAAACDWAVHLMITRLDGAVEEELRVLSLAGQIRSVKVFTTYRSRGLYLDDETLFRVIEASAGGEFVILAHAENDAMVRVLSDATRRRGEGALAVARSHPVEAEEEAVYRVLAFTRHAGGRIHLVHLSCGGSIRHVADARASGAWASGETCPHYLVLTEEMLGVDGGHRYATAPPLRSALHADALWQAVAAGDLHVVATDSCGFSLSSKDAWAGDFSRIPGGIPGVEVSLRVMTGLGVHGGRIGITDLVRLMSANPARLLGVYPQKGSLGVGSDADIVILDPQGRMPIHAQRLVSKAGWSPYEGRMVASPPERVYLRGSLVAERGRLVGDDSVGLPLVRGRPAYPL